MNNMKYLLVGVNAKYIHTSLAVRTLYHYAGSPDLSWTEYNINENAADVCADIYKRHANAVLFSCYIWNIEFTVKVAGRLKKIAPDTLIIFGGPEVSYADERYMNEYPFIDAVIRGEGEETVKRIITTGTLDHKGVTYRDNGIIRRSDRELIQDITAIPFPYTDEDIEKNKNKLIYYESSRGCPFNCSYCLSSTEHSVRYRELSVVFDELMFFIKHKVKTVKFTDRTFNAQKSRTLDIIKFLIDNAGETTFHFEIAADILDDEATELLSKAPKGLFQLEIGVQSTNPKTLEAIDRKTDINKIGAVVRKIKKIGNIHTHLDLIAGLPHEDFESFKNSFNEVYAMTPDVIQLGFLKLLHGTKIRREETNDVFTAEPPYEVLKTDCLSYDDILKLKAAEDIIEKYYNSSGFENAVEYLARKYDTPFDFFEALAVFYNKNGYDKIGIARERLYEILIEFSKENGFDITDILLYDYLCTNKPRTPEWAEREPLKKERFEILTEEFINNNMPEYSGMPVKEIIKSVYIEKFEKPARIIVFDKKYNRIINV